MPIGAGLVVNQEECDIHKRVYQHRTDPSGQPHYPKVTTTNHLEVIRHREQTDEISNMVLEAGWSKVQTQL